MQKINYVLLALIFSLSMWTFSATSSKELHADTLVIQDTGQFYSPEKPQKGMSKAQVRKKFGEPIQTYAAVGEPPITRWKFAEYTVYFEHNHVIHAVNNNRVRRP